MKKTARLYDGVETSAQLGGGGLPCPFLEIGKMCTKFGKKSLVAVIYELNFSFQVQFFSIAIFSRKNRRFFPAGPFFFVLFIEVF